MCPPPHPLIPLTPPFLQPLAMTPEDGFFLQYPSSYQEPRPFLGCSDTNSSLGPFSPGEIVISYMVVRAPRQSSGTESACEFGRRGLDPWVKKIPWRRKWQPIPVFLPEKFYGQRSLAGYSPWDHKESGYNRAHTSIQLLISIVAPPFLGFHLF